MNKDLKKLYIYWGVTAISIIIAIISILIYGRKGNETIFNLTFFAIGVNVYMDILFLQKYKQKYNQR